jgi:ADP-heptose:LPS heptosyltransferase
MHPQQSILLVRLKSMGDVLFTLPAVHAVRAVYPQARIMFLVSKEYAPLLQGFLDVDVALQLDRAIFKGLHPIKIIREAKRLISNMRVAGLQLAVDFQGYGETAWLTWASGAPERWGTVYRPGRKWAYTKAVPRNIAIHPAADCLAVLATNGFPSTPIKNEFVLPKQAQVEAAEFLSANQYHETQPILFIQPLTSASQKNWPLQQYIEVANHWRAKGWQILFGGGPDDRAALEPVRAAGYTSSAGSSLLMSAGLAKCSSIVLGGDTGLLHLAVAMQKRVAMLMRTLSPGSTHPFQRPEWAIAAPVEKNINSITVATVIEHCSIAAGELGLPTSL